MNGWIGRCTKNYKPNSDSYNLCHLWRSVRHSPGDARVPPLLHFRHHEAVVSQGGGRAATNDACPAWEETPDWTGLDRVGIRGRRCWRLEPSIPMIRRCSMRSCRCAKRECELSIAMATAKQTQQSETRLLIKVSLTNSLLRDAVLQCWLQRAVEIFFPAASHMSSFEQVL